MSATIVWFQLDLRLDDQPALGFAVAAGDAVIPVYCLDLERKANGRRLAQAIGGCMNRSSRLMNRCAPRVRA